MLKGGRVRPITEQERVLLDSYMGGLGVLLRNCYTVAWHTYYPDPGPHETRPEDREAIANLAQALLWQHMKDMGSLPFLAEVELLHLPFPKKV